MAFQLAGFWSALTGCGGPRPCGGRSAPGDGGGPVTMPTPLAALGFPAFGGDAGPVVMAGVPSAMDLPAGEGGCPLRRRRCGGERPALVVPAGPPPAPAPATPSSGPTWAALAAPPGPAGGAAPAGGGFFDNLLGGLRDLFRPAPQQPGLRQADAAVANLGRQGGQALDQVRGVVDQAIATGKGLLDRVVGFLRNLMGDVDRLVQGFAKP